MTYEPEEAGAHFWIDADDSTCAHLDVRDFLSSRNCRDEFVLECIRRLVAGQRLVIHLRTEPVGLRLQLTDAGRFLEVRRRQVDHWEMEVAAP